MYCTIKLSLAGRSYHCIFEIYAKDRWVYGKKDRFMRNWAVHGLDHMFCLNLLSLSGISTFGKTSDSCDRLRVHSSAGTPLDVIIQNAKTCLSRSFEPGSIVVVPNRALTCTNLHTAPTGFIEDIAIKSKLDWKDCGQHGWFPLSHTKLADKVGGPQAERLQDLLVAYTIVWSSTSKNR